MIRYDLKCDQGHAFDSWFQSSAAYDRLAQAGHVACPACGSARVEKALMAPAIAPEAVAGRDTARPLTTPQDPREVALAALRREIEEKSEYVGMSFAAEARAMHEGLTPERPIHGEARMDEARKLLEDGVPVAPLPFVPARKTN
jgi:hypothetical protein